MSLIPRASVQYLWTHGTYVVPALAVSWLSWGSRSHLSRLHTGSR